jgi:hypothetical protein
VIVGGVWTLAAFAQLHPLAGAWIGTSVCLAGKPVCKDERVVYHLTADPRVPTRLSMQMNKIVSGGSEEPMGTLGCTYDAAASTLVCDMPPKGTWRFVTHGNELQGGLTLRDGTSMRLVRVRRR